MNFFESLKSYVVGPTSGTFNYIISETPYAKSSIFDLFEGKHKTTNKKVTIFKFLTKNKSHEEVLLAQTTSKKLKTIRHPTILNFLDSSENVDDHIFIVTEYVLPLYDSLEKTLLESGHQQSIQFGLYQIISGLSFLHSNNLYHGFVSIDSIFVNEAGDWKLGNLGFLTQIPPSNTNHYEFNIKRFSNFIPTKMKAPEFAAQQWEAVEEMPFGIDSWGIGCLCYQIFQREDFERSNQLIQANKIPNKLQSVYKRLLNKSPESRITLSKILSSKYFESPFIETQLFLENVSLKDTNEVTSFMDDLVHNLNDFPKANCKYRILPFLLKALKFEQKSQAIIPVFEISKMFDEVEYKEIFIPEIIDLFSSNDKYIRLNLLKNLKSIIPFIDNTIIQSKIYPPISKGFVDPVSQIREETVKSMIDIVPKLNEEIVSNEVIKYMWKLQTDPEPGIRTNTIIAFGRLVPSFSEKIRSEWIINVFSRSLKDPFVHSRLSVLKAIVATKQYFSVTDKGGKILTMVSPMTIDTDKQVREAALDCMYTILREISPIVSEDSWTPKVKEESNDSSGYLSWAINSVTSIGKKTDTPTPQTATKPVENNSSSYVHPKLKEEIPKQKSIVKKQSFPNIEEKKTSPKPKSSHGKKVAPDNNWDNLEDNDTWEDEIFTQMQEKKKPALKTATKKTEKKKDINDIFDSSINKELNKKPARKVNTKLTSKKPTNEVDFNDLFSNDEKNKPKNEKKSNDWDFDFDDDKKSKNDFNWDEF
eukprot:gene2085-1957_t